MNSRERLLAVLAGARPDATPWFGDLSYWYDSQIRRGALAPEYRGPEGYLRLHRDTGVGIYLYAPSLYHSEYGGAVEYQEVDDGHSIAQRFITPLGVLTARQQYVEEAFTFAYVEHFVKGLADLHIMEYIFQNTHYNASYDAFLETDRQWGAWGLPLVLAPISVSPLQKLLARWAGVMATVDMAAEDPAEFERICTSIAQAENGVFEIIAAGPGQIVIFPENLSSEITGRSFFKRYSRGYYTQRIAEMHRAGKRVALHIDGTLRGLLPQLAETGLDIAEAVTPAPVGDVEVEQLRGLAGEGLVIWGGLPGALFSPLYSEQYFEGFVQRVLGAFPSGSRFVLGVADQVPPDAEFRRICRVREIVEAT